jgi:hypothetical protein
LFIDSDIAFKAQSAFNLLYADKDVISIPYPLKDMNWDKAMHMFKEGKIKTADDLKTKAFYRYPMKVPHDQKIHVKKGIIEVTHSPTGFMMIKREVFDKMIKAYPNFYIKQLHIINGKPDRETTYVELSLIPYMTLKVKHIWVKILLFVRDGKILEVLVMPG